MPGGRNVHPEDKWIVFNDVVILLWTRNKSVQAFSSEFDLQVAEVSLSRKKKKKSNKPNYQFCPKLGMAIQLHEPHFWLLTPCCACSYQHRAPKHTAPLLGGVVVATFRRSNKRNVPNFMNFSVSQQPVQCTATTVGQLQVSHRIFPLGFTQ